MGCSIGTPFTHESRGRLFHLKPPIAGCHRKQAGKRCKKNCTGIQPDWHFSIRAVRASLEEGRAWLAAHMPLLSFGAGSNVDPVTNFAPPTRGWYLDRKSTRLN